MLNEKQTDTAHWKTKLEDAAGLPGELLRDKNAAWEKLHSRLQEKPRRMAPVWYYIAAACLLLALLLPWAISNKNDNRTAIIANQQEDKTIHKQDHIIIRKETAAVLPTASLEKINIIKTPEKTNAAGKVLTKKNDDNKNTLSFVANNVELVEVKPESAATTLSSTDTAVATIAVVKKKLRVVNINELDAAPVVNVNQVALTPIHHIHNDIKFRFGIIHSTNPPAGNRQAYMATIKIPLTN